MDIKKITWLYNCGANPLTALDCPAPRTYGFYYSVNPGARYFKTRVYEINYSNVEKVLLMKVNFQEIL